MFHTATVEKNQTTYLIFNNFFSENCFFRELTWKNIVEPDRLQMTIWRVRTPCWINKAADTHSEYVILIALPRQQMLGERALCYVCMYSACLVVYNFVCIYIYIYISIV